MIETAIAIVLLVYGCTMQDSIAFIAAGLFALAVNIGNLKNGKGK